MANHDICHVEWSSTNLERTSRFYGGLFQWAFTPFGDEYLLFMGPTFGGGFSKRESVRSSDSPLVYVQVDDLESYIERAVALGGRTGTLRTEVPGAGWFATVYDPDDNIVGLWQGLGT